jgi:hypothetical protein
VPAVLPGGSVSSLCELPFLLTTEAKSNILRVSAHCAHCAHTFKFCVCSRCTVVEAGMSSARHAVAQLCTLIGWWWRWCCCSASGAARWLCEQLV